MIVKPGKLSMAFQFLKVFDANSNGYRVRETYALQSSALRQESHTASRADFCLTLGSARKLSGLGLLDFERLCNYLNRRGGDFKSGGCAAL
jgi:hypothetical protein